MIEYPQQVSINFDYAKSKIREFIQEDIPFGDKTTDPLIDDFEKSTAILQAEEDLILAGGVLIPLFFDDRTKIELFYNDGAYVNNGDTIAKISGFSKLLLQRERILLNLLQRMCGIATLSNQYAKIANPYDVKILDTRKTTPGLRIFEKYAVKAGGCYNHRMNLSSGILIKDNHIKAAGSITNAIKKVYEKVFPLKIEIEVENFNQILEALEAGIDGFLLDNMTPDIVKSSVNLIRSYPGGQNIFIEASGGINLTNLHDYVQTGVNAISIGALTHSVKSSNIHLEFIL